MQQADDKRARASERRGAGADAARPEASPRAEARPAARPDAPAEARPEGRVERGDIKRIIGFVALFSAGFETALRQIEPALTLSQLAALETIHGEGRMRPFRLAAELQISRQLAWQTCKRLEALGLVQMLDMGTGKRGVEVVAAEAGLAYLGRTDQLYAALAGQLGGRADRFEPVAVRRGLRTLAMVTARLAGGGEAEDGATPGETAPAAPAAPGRLRAPRPPRAEPAA